MGNDEKPTPGRNVAGDRQREAREQRLAEQLRANLLKRKAQARGRTADHEADDADRRDAGSDSDSQGNA